MGAGPLINYVESRYKNISNGSFIFQNVEKNYSNKVKYFCHYVKFYKVSGDVFRGLRIWWNFTQNSVAPRSRFETIVYYDTSEKSMRFSLSASPLT